MFSNIARFYLTFAAARHLLLIVQSDIWFISSEPPTGGFGQVNDLWRICMSGLRKLAVIAAVVLGLAGFTLSAASPAQAAVSAKSPSSVSVTGGSSAERAIVRGYVLAWGGNTHIRQLRIQTPSQQVAWVNELWGSHVTSVSHWGVTMRYYDGSCNVSIKSGMDSARLKYTVAHELAHCTQAYVWRGDLKEMGARMSAAFGGSSILASDRAADCAARVRTGSYYSGAPYLRSCTASQLSKARTFLSGSRI